MCGTYGLQVIGAKEPLTLAAVSERGGCGEEAGRWWSEGTGGRLATENPSAKALHHVLLALPGNAGFRRRVYSIPLQPGSAN